MEAPNREVIKYLINKYKDDTEKLSETSMPANNFVPKAIELLAKIPEAKMKEGTNMLLVDYILDIANLASNSGENELIFSASILTEAKPILIKNSLADYWTIYQGVNADFKRAVENVMNDTTATAMTRRIVGNNYYNTKIIPDEYHSILLARAIVELSNAANYEEVSALESAIEMAVVTKENIICSPSDFRLLEALIDTATNYKLLLVSYMDTLEEVEDEVETEELGVVAYTPEDATALKQTLVESKVIMENNNITNSSFETEVEIGGSNVSVVDVVYCLLIKSPTMSSEDISVAVNNIVSGNIFIEGIGECQYDKTWGRHFVGDKLIHWANYLHIIEAKASPNLKDSSKDIVEVTDTNTNEYKLFNVLSVIENVSLKALHYTILFTYEALNADIVEIENVLYSVHNNVICYHNTKNPVVISELYHVVGLEAPTFTYADVINICIATTNSNYEASENIRKYLNVEYFVPVVLPKVGTVEFCPESGLRTSPKKGNGEDIDVFKAFKGN